jgi:hypothetical protein
MKDEKEQFFYSLYCFFEDTVLKNPVRACGRGSIRQCWALALTLTLSRSAGPSAVAGTAMKMFYFKKKKTNSC